MHLFLFDFDYLITVESFWWPLRSLRLVRLKPFFKEGLVWSPNFWKGTISGPNRGISISLKLDGQIVMWPAVLVACHRCLVVPSILPKSGWAIPHSAHLRPCLMWGLKEMFAKEISSQKKVFAKEISSQKKSLLERNLLSKEIFSQKKYLCSYEIFSKDIHSLDKFYSISVCCNCIYLISWMAFIKEVVYKRNTKSRVDC